jgi:hypothetical protein
MSLGDEDGKVEVVIRSGPLPDDVRAAIARLGRIVDGASEAALARMRVVVDDEALVPEIARAIVGRGIPLHEMKVGRKSLEASFLDVMGEQARPG